jgi:Ser/Thr protein kinase RdoA (MazF antagonist)
LLAGRIASAPFRELGVAIGRIHAATANSEAVRQQFETGAIFEEIRLSPYLRATAARHPDLANSLQALADRTAATRIALVHGDLSPKNILTGARGVTILDAECAWYGDPAFDPAFFLNHVLLKTAHMPRHAGPLLAGFEAFWTSYLAHATWEPAEELSMRTAGLLGGLLLARIDGKSPVEYITDAATKERVRRIAREVIERPRPEPMGVAELFRNQEDRV